MTETAPLPPAADPHIGFIGLGIMGGAMAQHLLNAGYHLHLYSRTKSKAEGLLAQGAVWHDSPQAVAQASSVVITMLGYPKDVEETYLGPQGILAGLAKGGLVIDMTTSQPSLAQQIAHAATEKGCSALDAPVSGGDVGAKNGTLAIMVGGEQAAFDRAKPLFEIMGKTVALLGPAGSGQHTKMVNQIVIASTILGVAEALSYGKAAGLDLSAVLDVIGTGAAGGFQLNVLGKRMSEGDFDPGFFVHHFIKDMGIAQGEAQTMGLDLKALQTALSQFKDFAQQGGAEDGTQGIFKMYQPG
jgi:3-hydroxyisobutyrate dehydrogenase